MEKSFIYCIFYDPIDIKAGLELEYIRKMHKTDYKTDNLCL
jgi:hypothetical protein